MAKYTVVHSCGHSETVNLVGSHTSREWRLKRMEQEDCFECYKQAALEAAQQEAQEQELPPLHGTTNQIAWAETLRVAKLKELEYHLSIADKSDPHFLEAVDAITMETSSHQWIEWRNVSIPRILEVVQNRMKEAPAVASKPHVFQPQAIALGEATLRPEAPRSEAVAEIRIEGNTIKVVFPEKRDDFRELVRFQLGYEWKENCWQRTINPMWNGTPQDRASELGRVLLSAGFSVRCFDESMREKMLSGAFTPECTRWIKKRAKGCYTGWFAIEWSRNEDLYVAARRIKRSLYDKPGVVAPLEQFEEVLDFAQLYDFQLSEGAKALVEQARLTRNAALTVAIEPDPERIKRLPTSKPKVLDVPEQVEVLDEFKEKV